MTSALYRTFSTHHGFTAQTQLLVSSLSVFFSYHLCTLVSHDDVIFVWTDPLDMQDYWMCKLKSWNTLTTQLCCLFCLPYSMWFITVDRQTHTQSERGVLNNNCSSVLWEETAKGSGFSGIWSSSHKAAVWADLSCQPLFITSLHPGQHLNQCVCLCVFSL